MTFIPSTGTIDTTVAPIFSGREDYLAWRAQWRAEYAAQTANIRKRKRGVVRMQKAEDDIDLVSIAQRRLSQHRDTASLMMQARMEAKEQARAAYAARLAARIAALEAA